VSEQKEYSYTASIKSSLSDEIINTHVIRPLAGRFVRLVYPTPVTPNQITIAATFVGLVAAAFYFSGTPMHNIVAGLCLMLKDILDSADGQLARAKQRYSRVGRFLDSIGDFLVNLLAFAGFGFVLFRTSGAPLFLFLALLAFWGTTLRVSYHVFYQTSFLHLHDVYSVNRVSEEIRSEDRWQGSLTVELQRIFQMLYGWQDRLMLKLDAWCRGKRDASKDREWFGDAPGLRISGFLGLGTELFFLMLFSVLNSLEAYLYFNILALNAVWITAIVYRRRVLSARISGSTLPFRSEDSL
jgi:phosphatidylglycerophosphate synthase